MVNKNNINWPCFITTLTKYVLIDDGGDIRATSSSIEDIALAKKEYGWGTIHKASYNKKGLIIEEKLE